MSQYDQAIENLNTYLQDDSKVHEINDTIFTALDVSNSGTVCPEDALLLTKQILLGLTLTDHDEFRQQQRAPISAEVPRAQCGWPLYETPGVRICQGTLERPDP